MSDRDLATAQELAAELPTLSAARSSVPDPATAWMAVATGLRELACRAGVDISPLDSATEIAHRIALTGWLSTPAARAIALVQRSLPAAAEDRTLGRDFARTAIRLARHLDLRARH